MWIFHGEEMKVMRISTWMLAAALAVPAVAAAQNPPAPAPPSAVQPDPALTPAPPVPAPVPAPQRSQSSDDFDDDGLSRWIASASVGSNFGPTEDEATLDYGASIGYLWRGAVGFELLGQATPDFSLDNILFVERPMVNSYMANFIGAVPIGLDGQFQPFVSGGFGAIHLRQDILNLAAANPVASAITGDALRFGGNIGGGVMAFVRNVGIRGDVRYYRASQDPDANLDPDNSADVVADTALSGLDFWRANLGITFRW
jgi:hypothetical protein